MSKQKVGLFRLLYKDVVDNSKDKEVELLDEGIWAYGADNVFAPKDRLVSLSDVLTDEDIEMELLSRKLSVRINDRQLRELKTIFKDLLARAEEKVKEE